MTRMIFRASLCVMVCALFSCKKQGMQSNSPNQQLTATVNDWLNSKRSTTSKERDERVRLIMENLDYSNIEMEDIRQNEKYIIVPIKEGFVANTNKEEHPINHLLLITDNTGKVLQGNLAQFIPADKSSFTGIPAGTFSKVFRDERISIDGRFTVLSIFDKFLYEKVYADGRETAFKEYRPKKGSVAANSTNASTCTDWYLVTTTYYPDGTSEVNSEYLYRTCSSCAPNELCDHFDDEGAGGEVSVDYEYEMLKTVEWTVAVNPVNGIGKIIALEYIRGKKVETEPQGGHFKSIRHWGSVCNFCNSANPNDVWYSTSHTGTINSPQSASSAVAGMLYYGGNRYQKSGNNSWTFSEVFN